MRFFGFNISVRRDSEPAVVKDATQYALAAGLWPDEGGGTGTVKEVVEVNGSIPASPTITPLGSGFSNPVSLAVDGAGNVYVADKGASAVYKLTPGVTGSYTQSTFTSSYKPLAVAVDAAGDVYVQDGTTLSVVEIPVSGPAMFVQPPDCKLVENST